MATSLASQLAKIAAGSNNSLDLKAQKKAHSQSLIFEPQIAATQDLDTLYQICLEGFQELCQLDKRFLGFARTIFSEQSKREERQQMTPTQNGELDRVLENFLGLVGGRLLLKPALKAMEWLVRRFRIHEHNTQCLILTVLPYHTLPVFPVLLSILPRQVPLAFRFLHPYIESLANPPRHAIVHTATHNQALFSALSQYVLKVCRAGHHHRSLLSFWATTATEAVAGMLDQSSSGRREAQSQKQEDILLRVLPVLNEGLTMRKVPDLRVGCYMILTVLASKIHLTDDVLTAMMEAVASNWSYDTTHAGLICLSVLAEQRKTFALPRKVCKAIMLLDKVDDDLVTLNEQYKVNKLALGLTLGIVETLSQDQNTYRLTCVRSILESNIMEDPYISLAIKGIILAAEKIETIGVDSFDVQGHLADLILRLSDSDTVGHIIQHTIKDTQIDIKQLEMKLQAVIRPTRDSESEDVKSGDPNLKEALPEPVKEDFETYSSRIPTRTAYEISFLSHSVSYVFESLAHAFLLATSSPAYLKAFSNFSVLRRSLAMTEPLFLSFHIRLWCGRYPAATRAAAVDAATEYFRENLVSTDVQILLPYVIVALSDQSAKVRQATVQLVLAISTIYSKINGNESSRKDIPILGFDDIYGEGNETKAVSWLSTEEAAKFIEELLLANLEEYLQDASHIGHILAEALSGTSRSRSSKIPKNDLKASIRASFLRFLSSHVINTPLYSVKISLLSILNGAGKVGIISRTKSLLPLLELYESQEENYIREACEKEQIDESLFMAHLVRIVSPTDRDGLRVLQRIVVSENRLTPILLRSAASQRIADIWSSIKPDQQLSLAMALLDLVTKVGSNPIEEHVQIEVTETLGKVKLSSGILNYFLETSPALSTDLQEKPLSSKRRRTSHGHVGMGAKHDRQTKVDDLRRLTITLELIDSSVEKVDPKLLKGLFQVLANIQRLKNGLGTEMSYLQTLVLSSLLALVEQSRTSPHGKLDPSKVRADLLVDCLRTTASPQVQNSALLVLSSLATFVPEVIIHSVMPIFTFIGATVLRQNDDYSVHVINKTIDSIIPPLVDSLRKQKGGPLAGASEILLSFVATFEHIPSHRSMGLFHSLVDKLGPEEFLFALLGMLMHKYSAKGIINDFAVVLTSQYSVLTQLHTIKKYLGLIADLLSPKPTISEQLLGVGSDWVPETTALNLLSLPSEILATRQLVDSVGKTLSKQGAEATTLRDIYSRLIEQTLLLVNEVKTNEKLYHACSWVLSALLALPSLEEFIRSIVPLLEQPGLDIRHQVLKSLEHRIMGERARDKVAQQTCLSLLPRLISIIETSPDLMLKHTAVSCTDRIIEKFGKKDTQQVVIAAGFVSGDHCLGAPNPKLRIMALLCLATSVEVLGESIVTVIPQALPKCLDYLKASIVQTPVDISLHNAACSLINSLLTYLPWMITGQHLDRVLETLYESASKNRGSEWEQNRIRVLGLVAKRIESHECFSALGRTWERAVTWGPKAVDEHLGVLQQAIERHPKSVIVMHSQLLLSVFLEIFNLRTIKLKPRTDDGYTDNEVDQIERTVNDIFIKMIYKLNDTSFRPLFIKILEWATASLPMKDKESRLYRQTTWYNFLHDFFETLKSIVTSYASFIIDHTAHILIHSINTRPDSLLLWKRVLSTLHSAFEHDQDEFWQIPSHFTPISEPLISQLTRAATLPTTPDLIPAITELAVAADSPEHHREINAAILKHMRSDDRHVRLAAVQCEQSLTERLGEEWLSLLPEMLPFISELQEDDDESVERETQRWIVRIEAILGESLDSMLQ